MRKLTYLLILAVVLSGCDDPQLTIEGNTPYPGPEVPTVNLPLELRMQNWGGGSCVHASLCSVLEWQGNHALASWWRSHYSGGESYNGLVSKLDAAGVRYCSTNTGDTEFLEWANRTRRGAVIFFYPNHSITYAGCTDTHVAVLDNNRVHKFIYIDKLEFLRSWKGYGGVAVTPLGSPTAPLPY